MARDASPRRAPRGSARDTARSRRSMSRSRSASASSRSSRTRSRSRSRERASASRRSRSTSKPRHASRRGRRSRSRSTSRDRGTGRYGGHRRSSRRRERSRSRERQRHSRSSRKRSRRDRSRSAEGCSRRGRRDSSPRDDERGRERRQRRCRHAEVPVKDEAAAPSTATVTVAPSATTTAPPSSDKKTPPENASQDTQLSDSQYVQEKEDTPVSQESVATSVATATSSSQESVDVAVTQSKQKQKQKQESVEDKPEKAHADPSAPTTKTAQAKAATFNVLSIKQDILKALADARSTIAGIKGVVPPITTKPSTCPEPASSAEPDRKETRAGPETKQDSVEATKSSPASTLKALPHAPAKLAAAKPASPQNKQVPSIDVHEFDMFSAAQLHGAGLPLSPAAAPATVVVGAAVQSNFDDADGYYKPNIGEILNGKYRVMGTVGKGVFSTVLKCQRITTSPEEPENVAIKLIRNNEVMREAAQTEIKILTHLSERDPRDKKHCVRLLERFEHRNHVALVFESMQMNVREAMKKFGGKGGISIQAVRVFCKHLLIALSHLEACGVVHADIKPDNVLLDEKQTMIKLCDLGSAFESKEGKQDPTPYLVSRFYRAPEIVLGLPYDKAVDMWSVGCCLYEMFTGKVMFPGATNNEMLKLFMELKGKVPNKIIKKHRQAYIEQLLMEPHFTEDNKFCSHEVDRVTGKPVLRLMDAIKTRVDLGTALLSAKSSTDDRKLVMELRNLLERMFTLDPAKRITPKEALAHPFVKTEGKQGV